jgi:hypothetical protein
MHIFGAVIRVGGVFAIHICLLPALGTPEPSRFMRQS